MKVLILGAGIAGPTLAYWLAHYGSTPTLVEAAPALRRGGYIIDFWGAGFDVAERMGLLPELRGKGYRVQEVRVVDSSGRRIAGFPADAFARITHGRYLSLPRGELSAALYGSVAGQVETIFGDTVERIEQSTTSVLVTFRSGATREFDLALGADGLHSQTRELVFGSEHRFEKYLGYKAAAFEVEGYEPRDELAYMMYTQVGQQVACFSTRDNRTMFLLTFADPDPALPPDSDQQKAVLHRRFAAGGWECPRILAALDRAQSLYFDRVSQIHMEQHSALWSHSRVALVGDAAFCVSLLAGEGSALAMAAAYILAGELRQSNGDFTQAFRRYQSIFGPFIQRKQKAALRFAATFAPKSKTALFLRNQIFNLLAVPWIADFAAGRDLTDKLTLPDYEDPARAA